MRLRSPFGRPVGTRPGSEGFSEGSRGERRQAGVLEAFRQRWEPRRSACRIGRTSSTFDALLAAAPRHIGHGLTTLSMRSKPLLSVVEHHLSEVPTDALRLGGLLVVEHGVGRLPRSDLATGGVEVIAEAASVEVALEHDMVRARIDGSEEAVELDRLAGPSHVRVWPALYGAPASAVVANADGRAFTKRSRWTRGAAGVRRGVRWPRASYARPPHR